MNRDRTICFLLLPTVHLLDLSGAAQVFYEASQIGPVTYKLAFCGVDTQVISEQGLAFNKLNHFSDVQLQPGDFIVLPGVRFKAFAEGKLDADIRLVQPWLKTQLERGIQIASVCSGSLVLAETGILNGRKCTSHWKCIDYMKRHYPLVTVLTDRLFVEDRNVYTSAGMTSGTDMALSILESHHGPVLPAKVAREIVVYMRRNNTDRQQTIYLDYRTHFNPSIHRVQDHIISHPSENPGLAELASVGNTSVRSLTRMFKKATGHTVIEFKNAVKVELARTLVHNEDYTMEKISSLCGFESVRHFRRIWSGLTGTTLREYRRI